LHTLQADLQTSLKETNLFAAAHLDASQRYVYEPE